MILLETGKSQSGLFTRVAHDMKLMLDFHKGCKLLDFYFKVVVALFHDIIANQYLLDCLACACTA